MKIKTIPSNECKIIVEPRNAGNFGFMRISSIERSVEEEYRLCEDIKNQINRHIDNVEYVSIEQKELYIDEDENTYETLYEALEHNFDEEGASPTYEYTYRRKNDDCDTRSYTHDFRELIEEAYNKADTFNLTRAYPELTKEQKVFLDNVIKAGKETR